MEGRHSAEPDATVVRMVVAGSHAALAELYDRHAAAVFGASFRLLGQRLGGGGAGRRDEAPAEALGRHSLVADDEDSDPERQAELAALRVTIGGALQGLPATEREALVLAEFAGLTP